MTVWTDPARGIRWTNIVPLGVRVVRRVCDMHDEMNARDMAKRIWSTPSRAISEAMPEFFVAPVNMANARVVPIRGWKDE